jgi:hypothetical protein
MHDMKISLMEESKESGKPPSFVICNGTLIVNLAAVWPLIFIPIDFILYFQYASGDHDDVNGVHQTPTISLTGAYLPSSPIFTYGLHLEALFIAFACFSLYLAVDNRLKAAHVSDENVPPMKAMHLTQLDRIVEYFVCKSCCVCGKKELTVSQLKQSNRIALWLGLFAAFCMSIVGSVSVAISETAHSVFAFFMFLAGILQMLIFYFRLFRYLQFSDEEEAKLIPRILFCLFTAIPFNLFIILLTVIINYTCDSTACLRVVVNLVVVVEYTTIVSLLLYFQTFAKFLEDVILLEIVKKDQ